MTILVGARKRFLQLSRATNTVKRVFVRWLNNVDKTLGLGRHYATVGVRIPRSNNASLYSNVVSRSALAQGGNLRICPTGQ